MTKNRARPLEDRERVARWLSTPTRLRVPRTQGRLAAQMRISPSTISKWKQRDNLDQQALEVLGEMGEPYRLVRLYMDRLRYGRLKYEEDTSPPFSSPD